MTAIAHPSATAYIALGANLGDAVAAVRKAMQDLAHLPGTRMLAHSGLYRSAPVDAAGPDYINAVAALCTHLTAPELFHALQKLEDMAGRRRPYKHAPRTLDLDLLRYGDVRLSSDDLTLPHPRMMERAFVLRPLAEIAPALVSPEALAAVAGQAIERLP